MWKNRLKPYDILSGEDVEAIHEQAMTILEEIGVDFLHDRPRELFAKAGMAVDGMRVRFDRGFIMEMAGKTPSTFNLQARNAARTVTLGGNKVAAARWKKVLEEYPDPGIDPGIDEQLREFITKRKGEIGDD
jgi:trimethylamine:corrinoid methyltransferase-like protein